MRKLILILGVIAAFVLTGCLAPTQTVVEELDPATGKLTKRTTTSESVVKTVTDSTKDKWLLVSKQGWLGGIRAIPPASAADNPAGCLELVAGKDDTVISTMPMQQITPEVAAVVMGKFFDVVGAARAGKLEFGATGVTSGQ